MGLLVDINAALEIFAAAQLAAAPGAANVQFPGMDYDPVEGTPYAKVYHLVGRPTMASLGTNGLNRRAGVLQISLFWPRGNGFGAAVAVADAIRVAAPRGTVLTRNGTQVRLGPVAIEPQDKEDTWVSVVVSIPWHTHVVD